MFLVLLFVSISFIGCNGDINDDSDGEFKFQLPIPGADAKDWVINQYVDLDTSNGMLDYRGNIGTDAKVYNNHKGTDFDVPTFRAMDDDVPINAAAKGIIENLDDTNFDRNMCQNNCGSWNFVTVRHSNGYLSIYGHLKKNSVVVSIGQNVVAGQKLGVVGSSGNSTQPHLHFEVRDELNKVVGPFEKELWHNPPIYDTPLGLMDFTLQKGAINDIKEIMDPVSNITLAQPGDELGFGLSMAGGESGDEISIKVTRPNGSVFDKHVINFNQVYRHSFSIYNFTVDNVPGKWKIDILLNDIQTKSYTFNVSNVSPDYYQQVRHHIPSSEYQFIFDDITAAGYRPVWVDGYDVNGMTYFNAIFDKSSSEAWKAYHNLDSNSYQDVFDERTSEGYSLVHLDCYVNNSIQYAAIFIKGVSTAWVAYHGVSISQHQSLFNDYASQGYRPVVLSFEKYNGTTYVAGLYDKNNVGAWVALAGLNSSEYQQEIDKNKGEGKTLAYLNGYNDDGTVKFSAIWNSTSYNSWVARHNLSISEFQNEYDSYSSSGYLTKIVTGYQNRSSASFGGFWAK